MRTLLPQREWGIGALHVEPRQSDRIVASPLQDYSTIGPKSAESTVSQGENSNSFFSQILEGINHAVRLAELRTTTDGKIDGFHVSFDSTFKDWYVGSIPRSEVTYATENVVLYGGIDNSIAVSVHTTDNRGSRIWVLRVDNGPPRLALVSKHIGDREMFQNMDIGPSDVPLAGELIPSIMLGTFMVLNAAFSITGKGRSPAQVSATPVLSFDHAKILDRDEIVRGVEVDEHGCPRKVNGAHFFTHDYVCTDIGNAGISERVITGDGWIRNFPIVCLFGILWPIDVNVLDCCKKHDIALWCAADADEASKADRDVVACVMNAIIAKAQSLALCNTVLVSLTSPAGRLYYRVFFALVGASLLAASEAHRGHNPCLLGYGGINKDSCLCGGKNPTVRMKPGDRGTVEVMDCPNCTRCRLECAYDGRGHLLREKDGGPAYNRVKINRSDLPCCNPRDNPHEDKPQCPDRNCVERGWVCMKCKDINSVVGDKDFLGRYPECRVNDSTWYYTRKSTSDSRPSCTYDNDPIGVKPVHLPCGKARDWPDYPTENDEDSNANTRPAA